MVRFCVFCAIFLTYYNFGYILDFITILFENYGSAVSLIIMTKTVISVYCCAHTRCPKTVPQLYFGFAEFVAVFVIRL